MTYSEFTSLTLEQKCDAVWEWGFFVGRCREGELNKILYSLNGYFAEMIIRVSDSEVIDVLPYKKPEMKPDPSYEITANSPFFPSHGITG